MGNKQDVAASGLTGAAQLYPVLDPSSQLVAVTLGATLDLGLSVWSYFSDKRNRELFSSDEMVQRAVSKAQRSDDFASFVFDVWQKHNLESSKKRRKYLKTFLEEEVNSDTNDFENFSKIEHILQNASIRSLKLLKIIHTVVIKKRPYDIDGSHLAHWNLSVIIPIVQDTGWKIHEQDIEYLVNELAGYSLLAPMYGRMNGTFYNETKLGYVLMSYLNEE